MSQKIAKMVFDYFPSVLFVLFLVLFLLAKVLLFYISPFSFAVAAFLFVTLAVFCFLKSKGLLPTSYFYTLAEKIKRYKVAYVFTAILLTHFTIRVLSIFCVQIDYTQFSDPSTYVVSADELARNGVITQWASYFYQASHLFWFAVFLFPAVSCFGASNTAISVYLALVSTLSSGFIGATLYKKGGRLTAYLFMLIYALLPNAVISTDYITHEHAFLFFLSLFIWLRFGIMQTKGIGSVAYWALEIISTWILILGSMVNGLGLVAIIAVLIMYGLQFCQGKFRSASAKAIILILLMLLTHQVGNQFHVARSQLTEFPDRTEQYKWVLYTGANFDTMGHYSAQDEQIFFDRCKETGMPHERVALYHNQLLAERYQALFSHPSVWGKHYTHKIVEILGAFTHSVSLATDFSKNCIFHHSVIRLIMKVMMYTEAFAWGILALFILLYARCPKDDLYLWSSLFLTGSTMLFLLTEISSKYTISFQPILYLFLIIPAVHYLRTRAALPTTET